MKIRELIDLGFHINFVPIEESGSNPYFYVGCDYDIKPSSLKHDVNVA